MMLLLRKALVIMVFFSITILGRAQFLMDMVDTSTDIGKGMLGLYKRFDRIRLSGYIQPQYQIAQRDGIDTYNGGDFPARVDNRFMLRRGRIRFDYANFTDSGHAVVHFVFQFDGTERGVNIRDFWGRIFENEFQLFSLTMGMFARPFGYELNLSSSDRESPERGRMSQILMRTERDLGAMISFEPRRRNHPLRYLKWDAGFFNGQGLTAPGEFDSHKDFITRVSLKPYPLSDNLSISMGLSYLNGGLEQNNKYRYSMLSKADASFIVDSSLDNIGKVLPRKYYGADIQFRTKHNWGNTEVRGEYWRGKQTSSGEATETPTEVMSDPYFIRQFDGAFFYLLQTIVNSKHQVGIKYDWYDPNKKIEGKEIGMQGANTGKADIKYSTLSFGYNYYMNENLKIFFWYDVVRNESTSDPDFLSDVKDNIFTCRLQFRF